MSDGIEKLQKYAFGMSPRRCDDILLLADQIEREHASELQALEKRYKTDLREARDARDIAIKEAAELRDRLMPPGMEWPRFEDCMQITWGDAPEDIAAVCLALDGSCYSLHYDMPDDERMCIYEVSERVKRPVTVVLGADGLPIKVGETVWYVGEPLVRGTVEAVGEGEVMLAGDGVYAHLDLTHTQPDLKLRKCPFCGGEADMVDEGSECAPDRFWACCPNPSCFVEGTGVYATEEEAAQAWNTRVERTCQI
ncbi:Lar-like restriction alleviation protein [Eggerthella phage PMBT5]|uniref:Restriction alleviation protein n=1 Tax=Eggerthella phage PMBT5 TaxID=2283015 RepID=A0A345MKC5_9CAUD|nr:Lar-like restriction alleviation protein [Eggerthella phage PMBT5]AXH71788.1 restriction alleviation protein [Eggerthella phage PMBT5]